MNFKLKKSNLNFKVYTVPTKPTTAGAENDIAIISPVPMHNWIMSPDKPSGIPRSDGDVWIRYSVSGNTFNALKQNAMMIATISAWQYVDGAWVDREAVSYQDGEWVDWWDGTLYYAGDTYDAFTGGWGSWPWKTDFTTKGSATFGLSSITLTANRTSVVARPQNMIDITRYSKLVIDKTSDSFGEAGRGFIAVSSKDWLDNSSEFIASMDIGTKSAGTYELDISALSGKYYVGVYLFSAVATTYSLSFTRLAIK